MRYNVIAYASLERTGDIRYARLDRFRIGRGDALGVHSPQRDLSRCQGLASLAHDSQGGLYRPTLSLPAARRLGAAWSYAGAIPVRHEQPYRCLNVSQVRDQLGRTRLALPEKACQFRVFAIEGG